MPPPLRTIVRGLFFIAALLVIGFALRSGGFGGIFDQEWIDIHVRGWGQTGELIYLVGAAIFVALGLPRQVVSFLGGYAFGFNLGACLALAATAIGCAISFSFSRFVGRGFISKQFPRRIKNADLFLKENTFVMTLLVRLLPIGSNFITNLVAGVSSARATPFVAGSIFGYIPQTIIFALLGSGISLEPELRITVGVLLFVLSAALGIYLYRNHRQGRELTGSME